MLKAISLPLKWSGSWVQSWGVNCSTVAREMTAQHLSSLWAHWTYVSLSHLWQKWSQTLLHPRALELHVTHANHSEKYNLCTSLSTNPPIIVYPLSLYILFLFLWILPRLYCLPLCNPHWRIKSYHAHIRKIHNIWPFCLCYDYIFLVPPIFKVHYFV